MFLQLLLSSGLFMSELAIGTSFNSTQAPTGFPPVGALHCDVSHVTNND
jgi:hypothetical protein